MNRKSKQAKNLAVSQKKKKKVARFPQFPVEIWLQVISFISASTSVIALSDTCILLREAVKLPSSNAWAQVLNDMIGSCDNVASVLKDFEKSYAEDHGCNASEGAFHEEEIALMFGSEACATCSCICVPRKVYWRFRKRVCGVCIHSMTIKESALFFALDHRDESYTDMDYETFNALEDDLGRLLHFRRERHFWEEDIEAELDINLIEDIDWDEFENLEGMPYVDRKYDAVQALLRSIHGSGSDGYDTGDSNDTGG